MPCLAETGTSSFPASSRWIFKAVCAVSHFACSIPLQVRNCVWLLRTGTQNTSCSINCFTFLKEWQAGVRWSRAGTEVLLCIWGLRIFLSFCPAVLSMCLWSAGHRAINHGVVPQWVYFLKGLRPGLCPGSAISFLWVLRRDIIIHLGLSVFIHETGIMPSSFQVSESYGECCEGPGGQGAAWLELECWVAGLSSHMH